MRGRKPEIAPDDPRLPAIVQELTKGVTLISQSRALGFTHNAQLRAALRAHLGKEQYATLMEVRQSVGRPKKRKREA